MYVCEYIYIYAYILVDHIYIYIHKFREVRAEDRPETSRPDSRRHVEDRDRGRKEALRSGDVPADASGH